MRAESPKLRILQLSKFCVGGQKLSPKTRTTLILRRCMPFETTSLMLTDLTNKVLFKQTPK